MRIGTLLVLIFVGVWGHAHEEAGPDPQTKIKEYGKLLSAVGSLDVAPNNSTLSVPYVKIRGRKVLLNNHFYDLTEAIAEKYIEEIRGVCPSCEVPKKKIINQNVRELVAKGWFGQASKGLIRSVAIRYGNEFIYLGARYGIMAGALKVAGELVEDALLVLFKMPGAHFLCEVITTAITYYSGSLLSIYRAWSMARHFRSGGVTNMVRLMATSFLAKRAMKRIQVELGPIDLHPELRPGARHSHSEARHWLEHEKEENRRLERFLHRLYSAVDTHYPEIERLTIEKESASPREVRRIERKIQRLQSKMSKETKVSQKVFEGQRYGKSLWWALAGPFWGVALLTKRNRAMTLKPDSGMDQLFRGTRAWMVPLNNSIIKPSAQLREDTPRALAEFQDYIKQGRPDVVDSEINRVLLSEASKEGVNPEMLEKLFADIDSLFDTKEKRRFRYLRMMIVDGFFYQVMPKVLRSQVITFSTEFYDTDPTWKNLKKIVRLQWLAGRFSYYSDLYLDYLRGATLKKGKNPFIHEPGLAKDYFIQLQKGYKELSELKPTSGLAELESVIEKMEKRVHTLQARRFWTEKKAAHSLLPVRQLVMSLVGLGRYNNVFRKKAMCSKLYY